ncbi:MAG: hypothetical protein R3F50_12480 [Gammaproteobacteria bacterium]|jgi:hypothetical protein
MAIQDWGSIGELIGALATIATLVYSAIQVRGNTQSKALTEELVRTKDLPSLLEIAPVFDRRNEFDNKVSTH